MNPNLVIDIIIQMPEVYKERIIKLLRHADYEPQKLSQLAKAIGISNEDYPQFKDAFEQLRQAGRVVIGTGNLIRLPPMSGQIIGKFRANPKGFGFVIPLEPTSHGDLFIPPGATSDAMTGDTVVAKVKSEDKRSGQMRFTGEIIQVIQRAQNRFVGTLLKHPEGWLVQPDGSAFFEPVSVDDVTAKGAKSKDKVVVEILSYPTEKYLARGVIIEVLGRQGQYETEIKSIIVQYHLPNEFDADCLRQAHQAAAEFKPERNKGREDISGKVIITIDPADAKDFDDAISLERDSTGNWVLGVHIADVSNFVTQNSSLDKEAQNRGNSTYLPGRTIPMLPEVLSNGICSLQPGQKRFVKSVFLTYDRQGNILSRRFANSVMCSTQRLTYEQADRTLKGHTKGIKKEVIELLKNMETLARIIENRRTKNGMLHLSLPEIELVMDKSGRVVDAHPADDSYPHTIIEMFMVEANEAVASLLDKLNVPFIRRIHPEPDALSMKNMALLVKAFGFNMPRTPDRKAIQNLLAAVEGADCALAVNLTVLRSLEKAQYAPQHIGHFALASTHYCHFTSPIRRYADLLVHRVLQYHLQNRIDDARKIAAGQDLVETGKNITFTEQRAEDAEKELKTVLVLQMLSKKLGDELDCVVTGLTNFGVFVQSRKLGIEGLIQMADLGTDRWKYDMKSQCIIGQNTGLSIRLGQSMKVRIVSVNIPARQLNVMPNEPLTGKIRQKENRRTRKFKRKAKN
ncbi:MAG: ribonuclease R [Planctomycetes bacterium RBG_13_46_10]|nr:MAG: ribonuclease R [Planctomycetes bacterium RBG_13_46_10]